MTRAKSAPAALRDAADLRIDPEVLERAVSALASSGESALSKAACEGLPDREELVEWVTRCKRLVLMQRERSALRSEIPYLAERLHALVLAVCLPESLDPVEVVETFLERLPGIRERLAEDVEAAWQGDPAARGYGEIVAAYPAIRAIAVHRIAHELYRLEVPTLPRMMSEHAHGATGIDIHPGARIGRHFFIDHGTGVVIGETTEIGDDVRLYQGVTLGALAPRHGGSLRGRKRHPTLEDGVTIYAGATILGGETVIGRGSVVGGNVWLTHSIPPDSRVIAEPPRQGVSPRGGAADGGRTGQLAWDLEEP